MRGTGAGIRAGMAAAGAAALLAGCGTPAPDGSYWAPSLVALQQVCGAQPGDYGESTQRIYSTFLDAYVAMRHRAITQQQYCAFQSDLAQHYTSLATSTDPAARNRWAAYFLDQRVKALSWRASVDPTLRG